MVTALVSSKSLAESCTVYIYIGRLISHQVNPEKNENRSSQE